MAENLEKRSSKTLDEPIKRRWLRNMKNGRIFLWTPVLSVNPNLRDCTEDGDLIDPKDIPAYDPYILQETKIVAERLRSAGVTQDTVAGMGELLTELGKRKWKRLKDQTERRPLLGHPSARVVPDPSLPPKVQRMADDAHSEIKTLCLRAYWRIAGNRSPRIKPFNEVAYLHQRAKALEGICEL